jgi:hypothetical protein
VPEGVPPWIEAHGRLLLQPDLLAGLTRCSIGAGVPEARIVSSYKPNVTFVPQLERLTERTADQERAGGGAEVGAWEA